MLSGYGDQSVIPAFGRERQGIPKAHWLARLIIQMCSRYNCESLSQIRWRMVRKESGHYLASGLHIHLQWRIRAPTCTHTCTYTVKNKFWGWRGGAVVMSTGCSSRGSEFDFQHLTAICNSSSKWNLGTLLAFPGTALTW